MRYPQSANAAAWRWQHRDFAPAGMIYLGAGRLRSAPELAQRRAGTVLDLERARAYRLAGNVFQARFILTFTRAVRLALT